MCVRLLAVLLIAQGLPRLCADEIPAAPPAKALSAASFKAFAAAFPRTAVERVHARDENAGGTRLWGEALRVCADLVGFGGVIEQLEAPDGDGCYALARLAWDSRSEAFLLRVPGTYESNSRLLVIVQGRKIVSSLLVASGMGDAGETQTSESLVGDLGGGRGLGVVTKSATFHDRHLGMTEPDTETYALHSWAGDHFETRELPRTDPLLGAFRK